MLTGFELGSRARVDWSRLLWDLSRAGFGQIAVSRATGRSTGWVEYLRNSPGATPRFEDGLVLLLLWTEHTDRSLADVPRERQMSGISAHTA